MSSQTNQTNHQTNKPAETNHSISPNAKLLSQYQQDSTPPPSSSLLLFPLKSSFKPYSISNNLSSSLCSTIQSNNPPELSTPSLLKYNTHLNSRTSSPNQNHAFTTIILRSSSTPIPTTSLPSTSTSISHPTTPSSLPLTDTNNSTHQLPHRIIRTPRSFLIKRRSSLTPLMPSLPCSSSDPTASDHSDTPETSHPHEPENNLQLTDHKRKVRFDRDVFCLEFDQLPEELPVSRQKRQKTQTSTDTPSETNHPRDVPLRGNLRKSSRRSISNPSTRPCRHSPRLPLIITNKPSTDDNSNHPNDVDDDRVNHEQEEEDQNVLRELNSEKDSTVSCPVGTPNKLLTAVDISNKVDSNQTLVHYFHDNHHDEEIITRTNENMNSNCNDKNLEANLKGQILDSKEESSSSWIGRQRASSLPFDSQLTKVSLIDDLENKLNRLSLSSKHHFARLHAAQETKEVKESDEQKRLIRSRSFPNCSTPILRRTVSENIDDCHPVIGKSLIPSITDLISFHFAPRLKGVKQIFIDHPYMNKINDLSSSIQSFFNNSNSSKSSNNVFGHSTGSPPIRSDRDDDFVGSQLDDQTQINHSDLYSITAGSHRQMDKEECETNEIELGNHQARLPVAQREDERERSGIQEKEESEGYRVGKKKGGWGNDQVKGEKDEIKARRNPEAKTRRATNRRISSGSGFPPSTPTVKDIQSKQTSTKSKTKKIPHGESEEGQLANLDPVLRPMTRSFLLLQQKNYHLSKLDSFTSTTPIRTPTPSASTFIPQSPLTPTPRPKRKPTS